jgi:hypothetical protein
VLIQHTIFAQGLVNDENELPSNKNTHSLVVEHLGSPSIDYNDNDNANGGSGQASRELTLDENMVLSEGDMAESTGG